MCLYAQCKIRPGAMMFDFYFCCAHHSHITVWVVCSFKSVYNGHLKIMYIMCTTDKTKSIINKTYIA